MKKKKKSGKKFFSVLGWIFIGLLSLYNISAVIDRSTGYNSRILGIRSSVVVSGSMASVNEANVETLKDIDAGNIQVYDLIITKEYKSFDDIQKHDVITYFDGSILICHRVTSTFKDASGHCYLTTRGDANPVDDNVIQYSQVKGKVIKVIPKVGRVVRFFQSGYGLAAICFSVFFVSLGSYIVNYGSNTKKDNEKTK